MSSKIERLLTVADVADQLGVHPNTVRKWADQGNIPHVKLPSGYRRFRQHEVDRMRAAIGLEDLEAMAAASVGHAAAATVSDPGSSRGRTENS